MHQRCTVKTGSHYYIVTPGKNKTRRIILKTPDVQCNDRNIRCSVIDCNPLLTRKSCNDPCGLAVCLLGNRTNTRLLQKPDTRRKSRKTGIILRPRLKPVRHLPGLKQRRRVRPRTPKPHRLNRIGIPQIKPAGTGDPEKPLVSGKHKRINRQIPQRNRNMTGGLCSVHDEKNPVILENLTDGTDVLY